ncbi:MAG: DUF1854 domain-containing protein [Candidatus Thiodiazotropha sp.]|jgi:hypothetical protein
MKQLSYKGSNLYLHDVDGALIPVQARPCFPWSEPTKYISLRDNKNRELELVEDPANLDADSRTALESGLAASRFVFLIQRITSVEVEFEIRNWTVTTEQGERIFQTRLDEWPRGMPGGGFLLQDVAGDMFYIPMLNDLDVRSRELLSGYID